MNKQQYANFLSTIFFKKGEYVIYRPTCTWPYKKEDVWKVEDIQEVHFLCTYHSKTNAPLPISIRSRTGQRAFVSNFDIFKYINPPKDLLFEEDIQNDGS